MQQLLKGVRVIEICNYIAGPCCTQALADLGAEVIKVEKAVSGDKSRVMGPWTKSRDHSLYYVGYNRNKKSIEIDFRDPKGIDIIKRLVKNADVLIQNYRVGIIEKMGLGYDVLKEINPGLIQLSISGFGRTGPDKDRPAFDQIIAFLAGYYTVMRDGSYTIGPGIPIDTITALYATISILAALYNRSVTGVGQEIDLTMIGSTLTMMPSELLNYSVNKESTMPPAASPYGVFNTKNGAFQMTAITDDQFNKLKSAMNDPELENPKYDNMKGRVEDFDFIISRIQLWANKFTSEEVQEIMNEYGVPAGMARTFEQIFNDKNLLENDFFRPLNIEGSSDNLIAPFPARFSSAEYEKDNSAPELGEHSFEILHEVAGMSKEEIADLQWLKKATTNN